MQQALVTRVGKHTHVTRANDIPERERILNALSVWIKQRPGLDYRNYSSGWNDKEGRAAYFAEVRSITRDLHDARELLNAVAVRSSIGAAALRAAFRAYSGRLSWNAAGAACAVGAGSGKLGELPAKNRADVRAVCYRCKGSGTNARDFLNYCTGQYWPTEYRAAACAVLRSALWDYWRADAEDAQKRAPACDAFPDAAEHPWNCGHCHGTGHEGPSVRDRILKTARAELSRGVYRRWFRDA